MNIGMRMPWNVEECGKGTALMSVPNRVFQLTQCLYSPRLMIDIMSL